MPESNPRLMPRAGAPAFAAAIQAAAVALTPISAGLFVEGTLHLWLARVALVAGALLVAQLTLVWREDTAFGGLLKRASLVMALELIAYRLGETGALALHMALGLAVLVGSAMILRDLLSGRQPVAAG